MKPAVLIAATLVVSAALSTTGQAGQLRYWGASTDASVGWIDLGDEQYYEVIAGSDIPAWGRVKEIRQDRLVVEHSLSDAEKARLRERNALVHDVFEIHIPRESLRNPRVESWRLPTP